MRPDSTFRTASNTKTFTAAAALRLVENRKLSLEDRVGRFFPPAFVDRLNIIHGSARGREITVSQLLQHTSGLFVPSNESYLALVLREPSKRWTPVEQVELFVSSGEPYGAPGAVVHYSDTGYILLAMIIEQASELPLADALRTLLRFDELGLPTIHLESLEPTPAHAGPRVRQYFGDRDLTDIDPSFDLFGGGGLVSDVHDLARFWSELFGGRVFRSPATLTRMCSTLPDPERSMDVGLGVFRRRFGRRGAWIHTGFWGSFALHEPRSCVTVAGATNQAQSGATESALMRLQSDLLAAAVDGCCG
jgi:D-alanyl-D-alanine carboxypeptidase